MSLPFSLHYESNQIALTRRVVLVSLASAALGATIGPVHAEPADLAAAIRDFTAGSPIQKGKVKIDVAPLVENGNSVAIDLRVHHPMQDEAHVRQLALFNEKNPQPNVAIFHLSPASGLAQVSTRIRLATTQHLIAIAQLSDGSFWSDEVEVIVTIAACTEE